MMGETDGFSKIGGPLTIDENYLDGISLTHGSSPRQHIWSFAADRPSDCCSERRPSSVLGNVYFCDKIIDENNIAWDENDCFTSNNPPWFHRCLSPTTEDIEMRLCANVNDEDIRIQTLEMYVQ